ncbi:MAG: T9SS type A sorting domain-containing protein [Actinobacteria bacterium]|nr:T9SS type A sorting domain-containing protein [Actinomycetota bacterium]
MPSLFFELIAKKRSILVLFIFFTGLSFGQTNDTAIVETGDLQVIFTRGAITGIVNKLTGESYIDSSAAGDAVGLLHIGNKSIMGNNAYKTNVGFRNDTTIISLVSALGDSFSTFVLGEQQSGQVLVWQKGQLKSGGGVYGARLGFAGFDLLAGKLVLPLRGGVAINDNSGLLEGYWDYLTNWESQLAVFEGMSGSLGIWFEDSLFCAKRLVLKGDGHRMKLFLETHNQGNFSQRSEIHTPVIHLKAFSGDWRGPAKEYRDWMDAHLRQQKISEKPAWIDSIGCMVIYHTIQSTEILDSLAQWLNPQQVLIYVPDWRLSGYDVNYPDYTPKPKAAAFVKYAHKLGFFVMLHVNPFGIAPYNPLYQQFKKYQLDNPFSGHLSGWRWNTDQKVRHAFINPASVELQDMYIDKMKEVAETLKMDALHLDVDFTAWNSDNSVLNGENPAQGNRTFHQRLAEALPGIVLGGENLTEVNSYRDSFAQRWKMDVVNWTPHPISTFLYSKYTLPVGYLGFVNPDSDPDQYADFMQCYERWGVLPTLSVNSVDDLPGPRTQELIRIADAWARLGLRADFESNWDDETLFRFRGRNGEIAAYRRTPYGTTFVVDGDSLYRKVTGVNRLRTTRSIPGWYAYNENEIFGLHPDGIYWLDDQPADLQFPHLHNLPANIVVDNVSLSMQGGHFSLGNIRKSGVIDLVEKLPQAETAIRFQGEIRGIGDGAYVRPEIITLAGVTKNGIAAHPPYINGPGDVLITYSLTLPDSALIQLSFAAGIDEGALNSDGIDFFVEINGKKIQTTHITEKTWRTLTIDLSSWRGQTIFLTLGNDPGPPGSTTNYDWARWGDVKISTAYNAPFTAQLFLPFSADISGGAVRDLGSGLYEIKSTLAAELIFAKKTPTISTPYKILRDFDGQIGTNHNGLYLLNNRPWGAGNIRMVSCGGISKNAMNGHPPSKGSTVIQKVLCLPDQTPLKLSGSYGIADGSLSSGVFFSVYANGQEKLARFMQDIKWVDFEIDLTPFAGKSILLEFITSPGKDNYWDWANWADLEVSRGFVRDIFDNSLLPRSFHLSRPYPNPFNNEVAMLLETPQEGSGEFTVYNIMGQKVFSRTIASPSAGILTVHWNGAGLYNAPVSSGIYFMHVSFGEKSWVRKTLLLR